MINVIGSAIGAAAGYVGCEKAPEALQQSAYLQSKSMSLHWHIVHADHTAEQGEAGLSMVVDFSEETAKLAQSFTSQGKPFVNIGGDHSCAIGMWSGVANGLTKDLGLIWIDAHMDAHTFDTSPTGNIHGMPLAALLGFGDKQLTQIGGESPKLKPEHVCLVGIRCYEPGEAELLKKLNVRVIFMEEILDRGIEACMKEAIEIASKADGGFGMTVDVDGFDVQDAPAVGTPVQNGIRVKEFLPCVQGLAKRSDFLALEVSEYNPAFMTGELKTEKVVVDLLTTVFE